MPTHFHVQCIFIVYKLYFRKALLLFIDMRTSKKACQRVKNTYHGSRKGRTGNRGRGVYTL